MGRGNSVLKFIKSGEGATPMGPHGPSILYLNFSHDVEVYEV
jgi:hypothetical protein